MKVNVHAGINKITLTAYMINEWQKNKTKEFKRILILLENNQESKMGFWSFGTHLPMHHFFFKKSYYLPDYILVLE